MDTKIRCLDYFESLKTFGLAKIFEALPVEIRGRFLQEHLLPAAYFADHEAVHQLLELLFGPYSTIPEDTRFEIVHFNRDRFTYFEKPVYQESLVHVAANQMNKQMMMEVVRAEFNVHTAQGRLLTPFGLRLR